MTTILTLRLEDSAQDWFDHQRRMYFPPALNHIPAHLSLFHRLPGDSATRHVLASEAASQPPFRMMVDGVQSMGRGVMYTLASSEAQLLHQRLAASFRPFLTPQDRQPLRPHVVVQNKVEPAEAKSLLSELRAVFAAREVQALGLDWWEYLGGPWRLIESFPFAQPA